MAQNHALPVLPQIMALFGKLGSRRTCDRLAANLTEPHAESAHGLPKMKCEIAAFAAFCASYESKSSEQIPTAAIAAVFRVPPPPRVFPAGDWRLEAGDEPSLPPSAWASCPWASVQPPEVEPDFSEHDPG